MTAGDLVIKVWVLNQSRPHLASGLFLYFVSLVLLTLSYKYENIAVASMMIIVFNVVTLLVASKLLFGEHISSYRLGALVLALVSVGILELAN